MKNQSGFTLLEAVVAMAVFAMSATAIYAWVNTNLISLERVYYAQQKNSVEESTIDFMRSVDPIKQPKGRQAIGDTTIEWLASPANYSADVLEDRGQKTINRATLFNAVISIYRNGQKLDDFNMMLLGMAKVRDMDEIIFQ